MEKNSRQTQCPVSKILQRYINPLHTKGAGVVFISHKNRHSYNNACQVCSLLQTPADLYIFRKLGKYAFI